MRDIGNIYIAIAIGITHIKRIGRRAIQIEIGYYKRDIKDVYRATDVGITTGSFNRDSQMLNIPQRRNIGVGSANRIRESTQAR